MPGLEAAARAGLLSDTSASGLRTMKERRRRRRQQQRPVQLTLDRARKRTGHGGWRPGSGRPRGRTKVGHVLRPPLKARHPVHVTWRIVDGVRLGDDGTMSVIRAAIAAGQKDHFRVVEFNVLWDHLHFIIEADDEVALARGMQGLGVRIARRVNKHVGRTGKLLAERYHARQLRTPREVRIAIRYVLLNRRHHAAQRGQRLAPFWIDPCSSAAWFDGWRDPIRTHAPWVRQLLGWTPPTVRPRTWLLTTGWRRHGLIAFDEIPGKTRPPPSTATASSSPRPTAKSTSPLSVFD